MSREGDQPPTDEQPKGTGSASDFLPADDSLPKMADAVQRCQGCGLYAFATQAVFGEGPRNATLMLVGEQPGDREDVAGSPFVGPAGQLLDRALRAAGIDRKTVYLTNIVKHFKWKHGSATGARPPGKRRLHDKPNAYEVKACKPWLVAEIEAVKPAPRRLPRLNCSPGPAGLRLPRDSPARRVRRVSAGAADHCHGPSVVDPARRGRGQPAAGAGRLYPRSRARGDQGGRARLLGAASRPTAILSPPVGM